MIVKNGCKVKVDYTGKKNDGTVFDKSESNCPLEFTAGDSKLIPDFENAIMGMTVGDEKTIFIEAEKAYGLKDESLVRKFSTKELPVGLSPQKGMLLNLQLEKGGTLPATVIGLNEDEVVVDLNHPLAGEDLTFEIKVLEVEDL